MKIELKRTDNTIILKVGGINVELNQVQAGKISEALKAFSLDVGLYPEHSTQSMQDIKIDL